MALFTAMLGCIGPNPAFDGPGGTSADSSGAGGSVDGPPQGDEPEADGTSAVTTADMSATGGEGHAPSTGAAADGDSSASSGSGPGSEPGSESGTVSGCRSSADCDEPTALCDVREGSCVECSTSGDCEPGACVDGACKTYGQPCGGAFDCDVDAGETCCEAIQCASSCAIPCNADPQCPAMTRCEHGYCLLECRDDAGCAGFPGFTCQHMGTLCESD